MENLYRDLIVFKYEANLLYTESILTQQAIPFVSHHQVPFSITLKASDYAKAKAIVEHLELDETDVEEESDGYIAGYEEWADKMYVNGYFTGGVIPRWMYSKRFARWSGPITLFEGVFFFAFEIRADGLSLNLLGALFLTVCGFLLTIRGYNGAKS